MITLGKREISIIRNSFDTRFQSGSGLKRSSLYRSVKKDVEIDLQLPNIIFKPIEL